MPSRNWAFTLKFVSTLILLSMEFVFAQVVPEPAMPPAPVVAFGAPGMPLQAKVATMGMSVGMDASPVKSNPFCGTITTEHTQSFADGNRIHTTESSMLCRDSQGRIRREAQVNVLGGVPPKDPPKIVTIVDPVAGFRYMLDGNLKIARKMPIEPPGLSPDVAMKGGQVAIMMKGESMSVSGGPPNALYYSTTTVTKDNATFQNRPLALPQGEGWVTENIGDQSIGDLHATGTRTTTTIKAGAIGNDQPITIISENWYSPELKATVMTKHTDPWAGELKTQLTNVNYSEPDASLFTIPSDYRVVDEKPFRVKLPPPPAQ